MSVTSKSKLARHALPAFEASLQLRLIARGAITVLCVAAVFLFLFFPDRSGLATFALPALVIVFAALRVLGTLAYTVIWFRSGDTQQRRGSWLRSVIIRSFEFFVTSATALILSGIAVTGSVMNIFPLGAAAAMILLLATLIEKPFHGLFPNSSYVDRKLRLVRQTRSSLENAVLESGTLCEFSKHVETPKPADTSPREKTIPMVERAL